jgi:uncharacterized protein (DUF58 family)
MNAARFRTSRTAPEHYSPVRTAPSTNQPAQFLDPATLSELGSIEFIANRVVEGLLPGMHRSPFHGSSVEFTEHRLYTPGDDPAMIDWKAFAKCDRYYIKRYEAETNMRVMIVLDASGSMNFGLSTITKYRYAQILAACLTRLLLRQRDAVGFAMSAAGASVYLPPRATPGQFAIIAENMRKVAPHWMGSMAVALSVLAQRMKRRGTVVIISDAFEEVPRLIEGIHGLRSRGHETILFHVMAPEELTFSFQRWTRFEDLELHGHHRNLDPAVVRKAYLDRVREFLRELKQGCAEARCHYAAMTTDQPVGASLRYYLRLRAARNGASARR